MITSPIFGSLSDMGINRKILLFFGIVSWSICTAASYFSTNYAGFLIARMLVGVGEACFIAIAPSMLSDFFPPEKRSFVFTVFNACIPVGSALGFILGGYLGKAFGWRKAFLFCGAPGILVAFSVFLIQDPERGFYDTVAESKKIPFLSTFKYLLFNPIYVVGVAGSVAFTFAIGGMADWMPTYFHRTYDVELGEAGLIVGAITAISGTVGTAFGGFLATKLQNRVRNHFLFVSALGLIVGTPLVIILLFVENKTTAIVLLLLCDTSLFMYVGPFSAMIANCVPSIVRARAFSIQVLMIHLLGDSICPIIIGFINDKTGDFKLAISVVPMALGLAVIIWTAGWYFLPTINEHNNRTRKYDDESIDFIRADEFLEYGSSLSM
eukprot:TRINITY_DN6141_c0_g1_i2.p1 TRINITY_DN6141_c0_g1~~TRINITY_DN6141_c0_g1_i2.p1  ORF type:complete len:381 (-),score=51.19 TRINITY_DN6141_c0_g1_i2:40-1182(-)